MSDQGTDDPVARNRATPRRGSPGRNELGQAVTRRLWALTGVVLAAATLVLAAVLMLSR